MHLAESQVNGAAVSPLTTQKDAPKHFEQKSSSLPFGQNLPLATIGGPTYLTPQTLIQQVAFTLSDKLFTFSPETFDLDVAAKHWQSEGGRNAFGYQPEVRSMDTRAGAGSFALGYMFSKDFDLARRNHPQSIIASSASLSVLRPALEQLSLLYSVANPLVAHVAALDYAGGLVTDYAAAMLLAEELDLALLASMSAYESQHMALLATLLASSTPTIHAYDGLTVGRETTRIIDVQGQSGLRNAYNAILKAVYGSQKSPPTIERTERTATSILDAFNDELGTEYKPFEYHGHEKPDSVLVVFGAVEASLASQVASTMAQSGVRVGVINVRLYRPFLEQAFLESLPKSAAHIAVLGQVKDEGSVADQTEHSLLYTDVLATVTFSARADVPEVVDVKYPREHVFTPEKMAEVFNSMAGSKSETVEFGSLLAETVVQYSFWNMDDSASVTAPIAIGQLLSQEPTEPNITVRTGHDNFVQGGAVRTDIRSSAKSIEAAYSVSKADVAFVGDEKLLGEFDVVNGIKTGGILIAKLPGAKDEDLEKKVPVGLRKGIVAKELRLFVLDSAASAKVAEDDTLESYLAQLAFLKVILGEVGPKYLQKLASINGSAELLSGLVNELEQALREVKVPESWATIEPEVESISLPTDIKVNSFAAFEKIDPEPPALLRDWVTAAKGLVFKEAYGTREALRPDVGIKTSLVHVKEHRRLTPSSYNRNIFHIEFDLGESGLEYKIGEALGIHAENHPDEVNEFIKWYGLDPDAVVEVPTREDPNVLENRTVYQALLQNVDIFGRPPKRFYEALAEFADDEKEKQNLLTLNTPDGAQEFKRRAEVDTITFADLLLEFSSAHPSFNDIVRIVNPMKRREYSIASSQRVQPNSVSLLIVTVDWVDPKGRDRFGQATRYLDRLSVGAPVTVSVKPSVMKLPPSTKAPIIMAGLGTGLAPFRAFVQERALQKREGHDIGAVMLYMGSRHQREEYLYGEEWEAYQDAGIITLLGRAFSRDQPHKIYIQDRMRQTMEDIRQAYLREGGSFYLCGPTWPVPDVTEVLQEAFVEEERSKGKVKGVDGRRAIETLKDEGRYVLEVY